MREVRNLDNIKTRLRSYRRTLAEKKELEFRMMEMKNDIGVRAVSYEDKGPSSGNTSTTENQAIKLADTSKKLERLIEEKGLEIHRIENALSVLDDKERKIIELKHIKDYSWEAVSYQIDRSSKTCKTIERQALMKMDNVLNLTI